MATFVVNPPQSNSTATGVPTGPPTGDYRCTILETPENDAAVFTTIIDFWGTGSPQNVVTASPNARYADNATGNIWVKVTGTGSSGWQQVT